MRFEKQTFENQDVRLDGNEFVECVFNKCNLLYGGMAPISLDSSTFNNSPFIFTEAALNTLQFMTGLYHGGLKQVIEAVFEDIRKNQLPTLLPGSDTKAVVTFYKCIQNSQEYGSDDEHMGSRIFFKLFVGGKEYPCYTDVKQIVGSDFETEKAYFLIR